MISSQPARTPTRRVRIRRLRVAGVLVAVTAIAATIGDRFPASSSSSSASSVHVLRSVQRRALGEPDGPAPADATIGQLPSALGEADGAVPDGTTVFDDEIPGVGNVDRALLAALRQAATHAAADGVVFHVDSGWRSPEYQEHLRQEAVSKYGSEAEAARWVASANTSPHVSGKAVDIGPSVAAAWLFEHGADYGLCQIYDNEPWHYELRAEATDRGCPPTYADPTHDPRMQP